MFAGKVVCRLDFLNQLEHPGQLDQHDHPDKLDKNDHLAHIAGRLNTP